VELIVSLSLAVIVIGAAIGFILSGSSILDNTERKADEQRLAIDTADLIKEQLIYASSIYAQEAPTPPPSSIGSSVLYIGNADGTETAQAGYLFIRKEGGTEPINVFGAEYYKDNTLTLDYYAIVPEGGGGGGAQKSFSLTLTVIDSAGNAGYSISRTFELPNSDDNFEPTESGEYFSVVDPFYLAYYGYTYYGDTDPAPEDIIADGDYTAGPTAREQTVTIPKTGTYRIEAWGADGGNGQPNTSRGSFLGGKGGYAAGTVYLTEGTTVYLKAGGKGRNAGNPASGAPSDSFNGGGLSNSSYNYTWGYSGEGGGASDVRVLSDNLYNRILVAGGGGGAGVYDWGSSSSNVAHGGNGGGLAGAAGDYNGNVAGTGGTQISAGTTDAAFGTGGSTDVATNASAGAGGGGGWYGGGASARGNMVHTSGAGGGSGYVLTTDSYRPSGYFSQYAGYRLTNPVNVPVTDPMFISKPTTGHSGYVKISFVS
jgi:hypothetical protein